MARIKWKNDFICFYVHLMNSLDTDTASTRCLAVVL